MRCYSALPFAFETDSAQSNLTDAKGKPLGEALTDLHPAKMRAVYASFTQIRTVGDADGSFAVLLAIADEEDPSNPHTRVIYGMNPDDVIELATDLLVCARAALDGRAQDDARKATLDALAAIGASAKRADA